MYEQRPGSNKYNQLYVILERKLEESEESDLSDEMEYLDEKDKSTAEIRLRLQPCRLKKIKQLFYSDTVS